MNNHSDRTNKNEFKTALVFFSVIVLLIALGLMSYRKITTVNQLNTELDANWLPSTRVLGQIKADAVTYRLTEMEHVLSLQEHDMMIYETKMDSLRQLLTSEKQKYEKLISSLEEQKLYEVFITDWKQYEDVSNQSISLSKKNLNQEAVSILRSASLPLYENMMNTLDQLIELNMTSARADTRRGNEMRDSFMTTLLIILSLGGLTLFIFVYDLVSKK